MPYSNSLNNSFTGSAMQEIPEPRIHSSISNVQLAKKIIMTAIPLSAAQLAQFLIVAILAAMVGQLGVHQLDGVSLAFGMINATAFSFAAGLSGALETVLSHSYGRDPTSKMYGIYAQRMTVILLVASVCIAPVMAFADHILLAIGQHAEVVYYAGVFCRIAMWGIVPSMMLELMRRYYACQRKSKPLSINLIAGAIINPFLILVLKYLFEFSGAAVAWVVLMTGMSGSLIMYLWWSGLYKQTWGGIDELAFHNYWPLLKLAIPSMAMILSEWVALEVNIITAGYATPESMAGFTVMYQISGLMWSTASGVFIAASVLVGNAIGEGDTKLAKRAAHMCILVDLGVTVVNFIALFLTRGFLPYFFTQNEVVVDVFNSFLWFYPFYHVGDTIQSTMMGILRGCGMQKIGAVCIAVVYTVVGVPVGLFLFFGTEKFDHDVRSLWIGPTIAVVFVGLPMYAYILFFYISWDDLHSQDEVSQLAVVLSAIDEHDARSVASMAPYELSNFSDNDVAILQGNNSFIYDADDKKDTAPTTPTAKEVKT